MENTMISKTAEELWPLVCEMQTLLSEARLKLNPVSTDLNENMIAASFANVDQALSRVKTRLCLEVSPSFYEAQYAS